MAIFKYVVKDNQGYSASGDVEAPDRQAAMEILRKKEMVIISLEEVARARKGRAFLSGGKKKVKLEEIVVFSRQLATMSEAGIPLVNAFSILEEQSENKTFREVIGSIRHEIETGSSLSEGLAKHKAVFSPLFVNMVKAGESSGTLAEILDRLAEYLEKTNALQKKVQSALVYPAVVTLMALGITFILLWKVVPVFKSIFEGFNVELPLLTRILIAISNFIQNYFIIIVIAGAGVFIAFNKYIGTDKGRKAFDGLLLGLPIFGVLFKKVAVSKFTRTLSTLVKSGVPILAALEIVAKTAGNKVMEVEIDNVRVNVREGENIAGPLSKSKVFPIMVARMIAVGEQAGELEKMLSKIADFYDQQVDAAVSALTSLIEPLIIAFLGIVIGTIVMAMFMPIFKLSAVLGG